MLYQQRSFTLPATNPGTSQKEWDRAFMSSDSFFATYGEHPTEQQEFKYSVPDATGCSV